PNAVDVSSIIAGRDITSHYDPTSATAYAFNVRLGGPGYLEVQAGRDVLMASSPNGLARSAGIASIGNADNILLPKTGASVGVMTGVGAAGPQNAAFIDAYFDPATAGASAGLYDGELLAYMRGLGFAESDFADAVRDFRQLSPMLQAPMIQKAYFAEIKAGGKPPTHDHGAP